MVLESGRKGSSEGHGHGPWGGCKEKADIVISQEEPGTEGEAGAAAEAATEAADGFECITAGIYEEPDVVPLLKKIKKLKSSPTITQCQYIA